MLTTLRTVVLSVAGSLLVIGAALFFVLRPEGTDGEVPPGWLLLAQVVAAVVLHVVITLIGYRTPAIPPGTPHDAAGSRAVAAFSSTTFLRLALAESLALVSVAATFVVADEILTYVVGAVLSLVLILVHALPGERVVAKIQASLEREGATSHLRERLDAPAQQSGPIQRL